MVSLPSAQNQFNALYDYYSDRYEATESLPPQLETLTSSYGRTLDPNTYKFKERLSEQVRFQANVLQGYIASGQTIKVLSDLLDQGIKNLDRPPLTLTTNPARLDATLSIRCTNLFEQNVKNVATLKEALAKVKSLDEDYHKKLQGEVMPAWQQFAKTYGQQRVNEAVKNDKPELTTEETSENASATDASAGIFSRASEVVTHLAGNIFSRVYDPNTYEPTKYIDPNRTCPLPEMQNYAEFFQNNIQSTEANTASEAAVSTEDGYKTPSCSVVYEKLNELFHQNYNFFFEKLTNAELIKNQLQQHINDANEITGDSEALKERGNQLKATLSEIGKTAAQLKMELESLKLLNSFFVCGIKYLSLPHISETDVETIKVLEPKLWDSISEMQTKTEAQFTTLNGQFGAISGFCEKLEQVYNEVERKYHHFRYQVENLNQGCAATLSYKQQAKVTGTIFNNPTDAKLPQLTSSKIKIVGFNSENMDFSAALDEAGYLSAILDRMISAEQESDKKLAAEAADAGNVATLHQDPNEDIPPQLLSEFTGTPVKNSSTASDEIADGSTTPAKDVEEKRISSSEDVTKNHQSVSVHYPYQVNDID